MPFGSSARPVSSSRPLFLFISRAGFWVNQNEAALWRSGQTPPSEFRPRAPSHCQRRRRSVGTEAGAIPTAHGRGQMAHHPPRKRRPRAPRRVSGRSPAQYIAVRCVIAPLATASTGRGVGQGGRATPRATAGGSWPRRVGTWAACRTNDNWSASADAAELFNDGCKGGERMDRNGERRHGRWQVGLGPAWWGQGLPAPLTNTGLRQQTPLGDETWPPRTCIFRSG